MRLIDADYLKEWITSHFDLEFNPLEEKEILRLIDDQPTAYDLDKVIEQLEEREREMIAENDIYVSHAIYEEVIDIVKEGVIDETD